MKSIDLDQFSQLLIAEDESELRMTTLGTVPAIESEESFEKTLEQLKVASGGRGWPVKPIARVIAFGGSALFSYREGGRGSQDRTGVYEVVLAGGHDPTLVQFREGSARLLVIAMKSGTQPGYLNIGAFFKSSQEISCSACKELAERIQTFSHGQTVEVQARPDTWFAHLGFPLMFRFEPDNVPGIDTNLGDRIVPPKVDQFYHAPHTGCYWNGGRFSCKRYGTLERIP